MPRGGGRGGYNAGRGMTYDFGVSIASRTINNLHLMTGYALSLTAAIYGLSKITSENTDMVKQNQLVFGGTLKTMAGIAWAQEQLLKGATEFNTGDILSGMRQLASAGVNAKEQFKFLSDAAQATGQNFSSMAANVANAVSGNMSGLVQMGLMTERSAVMFNHRYIAGTNARKAAIMGFLHAHKGLNLAISESFHTITGSWERVMVGIRQFATAIMGNPNDPNSLYQRIRGLIAGVADWIHKHAKSIRKFGTMIGTFLGYIVKQIGGFLRFIGRQLDHVITFFDKHMGNFRDRMYSMLLWLELWKVHIIHFLKEHKDAILAVIAAYAGFKVLQGSVSILGKISQGFGLATAAAQKFRKHGIAAMAGKGLINSQSKVSGVFALQGFLDSIRGIERKSMGQLAKERNLDLHSRDAYRKKIVELTKKAKDNILAKGGAKGVSPGQMTNGLNKVRKSIIAKAKEASAGYRNSFFMGLTKADTVTKGKNIFQKIAEPFKNGGLKGGIIAMLAPLRAVGMAAWNFTAAMLANPVGAIVAGVLLLAAGVYLLYKNWDKVREASSAFNDTTLLLITSIMPIVGTTMIIAKYWDTIRSIGYNIYATIFNLWQLLKNRVLKSWGILKRQVGEVKEYLSFMKPIFSWISDAIDSIGRGWDKFKTGVVDFFKDSWIGKGLDKLSNLFGKTAENSAAAAKAAGLESMGPKTADDFKAKDLFDNGYKKAKEFMENGADNSDIDNSDNPSTLDKLKGKVKGKLNPLIDRVRGESMSGESSTVNVNRGAVTITIQKGDNINEARLVQLIEQSLPKIMAKAKIRSGQV